jgi:hypothetical protein
VGIGRLVVKSVVRELLRLAPATVHLQHHLDCFQALDTAKIAIEAPSWLGRVRLVYLEDRLLQQWHDEWLHERLWKMPF